MAQKIVGLDIGSYSIKAVVLESTYRNWELIGYHESLLPSGYTVAERMVETHESLKPDITEEDEIVNAEELQTDTTEDTETDEESVEEIPTDEGEFDPVKERKRIAIHDFLRKYGSNWDSVYTALDSDTVSLKMLSMPFAETKQIDETIHMTLEDMVPFSLSGKLIDYQILKKEPGNNKILAALVDKLLFKQYLAIFENTDNEPKKVLLDTLALGNIAMQFRDNEDLHGTYAIIDLGHRTTTITVISTGDIAFARTLHYGGQDLTQAIANSLDTSFINAEKKKHREGYLAVEDFEPEDHHNTAVANILEEALVPLVSQIKLTLKAYTASSKLQVEKILLTGGSSKLKNIDRYLSDKLELPVQPFNYLKDDFNRLADSAEVEPNMATGLGIAFSGMSISRKKSLNFRKGDLAFKGDFEYWKARMGHIALNATFIFLFFILSIWSQFHVLNAEEEKVADSITQSCKSILGREVTDAKICISSMMEVINKQGTGGSKLKPSFSLLTIYEALISRSVTSDLDVELEDLEISEKKIKIRGQADSIPTVGTVVENLKEYYCFTNVKQGPTKSSIKGDRIQFSVSILIDCSKKKPKRSTEKAEKKEEVAKDKIASEETAAPKNAAKENAEEEKEETP